MIGLGMGLVSAMGGYKAGMLAAAKAVFTDATTHVCSGDSSTDAFPEVVSIGRVQIGQVPATLGSNRGREETLTCEVTLTVFTGGDDDQQSTTDVRCAALLSKLEQQVHYTDTTLGGVVRECFLTDATLDSGAGEMGNNDRGRLTTIDATFTARARILNG